MFRLIPVWLSFLALAAHFLRHGNLLLVAGALGLILVSVVRRPWVPSAVQVALLLSSGVWIYTLFGLVGRFRAVGQPWERTAWILGGVAAFTLASGLVFRVPALRQRYGRTDRES